jgi:hypothetical protein
MRTKKKLLIYFAKKNNPIRYCHVVISMALPLFMQMMNCSHKHRLLSECSKFRIKKPDLFLAPPFRSLLAIGAQRVEEEDANAVRSGLPPSSISPATARQQLQCSAQAGAFPTLPQQLASLLYPLENGRGQRRDWKETLVERRA